MYRQLSRKEWKENSSGHTTRSTILQARTPFQDITNVIGSNRLSKGKQGTVPTNASEHKRYHDRERYLAMTPEQRTAYLQRNREYKRRMRTRSESSDSLQSGMSQINTSTSGNLQTVTDGNTRIEVATIGSLNLSPSNILQENVISPHIGSQIMINPSDISTSCNVSTSTNQHKRKAISLDNGCEYKRIRISNEASCSGTTNEIDEYVGASTSTGQYKRTKADLDNTSKFNIKRMSDAACCSSMQDINECSGNLLTQCIPLQTRCVVAKEHEDHDSTIYVPKDCFPAMQDESGQVEYNMIEDDGEDDGEDDECYLFSAEAKSYRTLRESNFCKPEGSCVSTPSARKILE